MRYIFGLFITLGLIILILVLLFRGGGGAPQKKAVDLGNYLTGNGTAQLVVDGPILSQATHNTLEIDVSPNQVSMVIYKGYQQDVDTTQTYPNNQSAYAVFLKALQHAGFTNGNSNGSSDERGYCPAGERFIYTFINNGDHLSRFWSDSCGDGTFKGNGDTIRWLFRNQVPDYNTIINGKQVNA